MTSTDQVYPDRFNQLDASTITDYSPKLADLPYNASRAETGDYDYASSPKIIVGKDSALAQRGSETTWQAGKYGITHGTEPLPYDYSVTVTLPSNLQGDQWILGHFAINKIKGGKNWQSWDALSFPAVWLCGSSTPTPTVSATTSDPTPTPTQTQTTAASSDTSSEATNQNSDSTPTPTPTLTPTTSKVTTKTTSPTPTTSTSAPKPTDVKPVASTTPNEVVPTQTTPTIYNHDVLSSLSVNGIKINLATLMDQLKVEQGNAIVLQSINNVAPYQVVTIYLYSDPKTYTTTADSTGTWRISIPTTDLAPGDHHVEFETSAKSRTQLLSFQVTTAISPTPTKTLVSAAPTLAVQPARTAGLPVWLWWLTVLIILAILIIGYSLYHKHSTFNNQDPTQT